MWQNPEDGLRVVLVVIGVSIGGTVITVPLDYFLGLGIPESLHFGFWSAIGALTGLWRFPPSKRP